MEVRIIKEFKNKLDKFIKGLAPEEANLRVQIQL